MYFLPFYSGGCLQLRFPKSWVAVLHTFKLHRMWSFANLIQDQLQVHWRLPDASNTDRTWEGWNKRLGMLGNALGAEDPTGKQVTWRQAMYHDWVRMGRPQKDQSFTGTDGTRFTTLWNTGLPRGYYGLWNTTGIFFFQIVELFYVFIYVYIKLHTVSQLFAIKDVLSPLALICCLQCCMPVNRSVFW